jgi:aryl-alcohol dehydrogenase-like predicted oxidoreductase
LVSPIGFGAFKIGRNEGTKYPAGYALPEDREAQRLLNGVLDLGVNLIDTAPAYGTSEERIGRLLAGRRAEFVISTKVGESFDEGQSSYDFSTAAVAASIERSLRRLRTDVLDLVFVHAHGGDVQILEETDVVAALHAARQRGDVRKIGFSGKTVAAARSAMEWADALMVEYHADDVSHAEVMADAAKMGVGVIVKKALASGRLEPERAIGHALRHSGVTSVLVGTLCLEHLRENVRYAEKTLSDPCAGAAREA